MSLPLNPRHAIVALLLAGVVLSACTRQSDAIAAPDTDPPSTPTTPSTPEPQVGDPAAEITDADTSTAGSTSDASPPPPVTPISVVEVAEVGVPGLDSDDAFCASWSRFAGSFQVVAVTSAFGSGAPEQLAALEVAAAPTVTAAYDDIVASWPDELSSEADLALDDYFGPFARRLDVARQSLVDVGADDGSIEAISDAWLAGLAQRDPSTPEFVVDLPDELWAVIDAAAAEFSARRVPFGSDPSLVTNVDAPLTLQYLAVACPDQGTLSGQEVDTP